MYWEKWDFRRLRSYLQEQNPSQRCLGKYVGQTTSLSHSSQHLNGIQPFPSQGKLERLNISMCVASDKSLTWGRSLNPTSALWSPESSKPAHCHQEYHSRVDIPVQARKAPEQAEESRKVSTRCYFNKALKTEQQFARLGIPSLGNVTKIVCWEKAAVKDSSKVRESWLQLCTTRRMSFLDFVWCIQVID